MNRKQRHAMAMKCSRTFKSIDLPPHWRHGIKEMQRINQETEREATMSDDDDGELCMGCDLCDEPITGEQEFTQGGLCDECWHKRPKFNPECN